MGLSSSKPGSGRLALLIVLAALALHLPSLGWGFLADDYVHLGVLDGSLRHPSLRPWSLFDFGECARPGSELWESGAFPWWTDSDWKGRFLRPLSSVARWGTHAVFGRAAPGHHAVSLALFALVLGLAWRLYRASGLAPRAALLALALVALEDGAVMPVGWVANQNTLLEAAALLGALLVGRRAERSGGGAHVVGLALALALCAALAKESGVLAFALLAWRWRVALPRAAGVALAAGGAYLAAWVGLGYGVRSLGYPAPWTDPASWVSNLAALAIGGPASALSPYMLDLLPLQTSARFLVLALTLPFVLLLWIPIARAARSLPNAGEWWALALLGLLPQAGTWPSDRLLFVPMLGFAPVAAHAALELLERRARAQRALAWLVLALALPLSALSLAARSSVMLGVTARAREALTSIDLARDGRPRRVVLLQSPSGLVSLQPSAVFAGETGERQTRFFPLQMGRRPLALRRLDACTLEVESRGEPFGQALFEQVFRTASGSLVDPPLRRTAAFAVVPQGSGAAPTRLRLEFDAPLERGDVVLVGWRHGGLRVLAPPPVGGALELAAPDPLVPGMP